MSKTVFKHAHPYAPILFKEATKLIVGTLPPPRFTIGNLKEGDVDFCYGSRDGQLWPILNQIFRLNLSFETTEKAVQQRINFLKEHKIGICDMVESAERTKIDASDLGMQNIVLRDMFAYLQQCPKVDTLLFTGGNSKNGPEYFFRKYLRKHKLSLKVVSNEVPRIHQFELPSVLEKNAASPLTSAPSKAIRSIRTVSLTAPSGAANRAVGGLEAYKKMKSENPEINTIHFRIQQYKDFF